MSTSSLPPSTQKVVAAAKSIGLDLEIVTTGETTRTAPEAAAVVGCDVGQIVKSLVFTVRGEPVMALVSGANQLDMGKLAAQFAVGKKQVERANADIVRNATGYAIGGVPPFGHATTMPVFIDRDLTTYDIVWAAAGTPFTVFGIAPSDLVRASGGAVVDLAAASTQ